MVINSVIKKMDKARYCEEAQYKIASSQSLLAMTRRS